MFPQSNNNITNDTVNILGGSNMTNKEFEQYRLARIEAHEITRAALEAQFASGALGLSQLDAVIEQYLNTDAKGVAPWRTSEHERVGCREGVQVAALEFYWKHRKNFFSGAGPELTPTNKIAIC